MSADCSQHEQGLGRRANRLVRLLLPSFSRVLLAFCIDMARPLWADGHLLTKASRKTLKTGGVLALKETCNDL